MTKTKPNKLTKVQKEILAVLEEGGWIGSGSSFGRFSRPLLRANGLGAGRRVVDATLDALRKTGLVQALRIEPALKVRDTQGGQFPSGKRNTLSISQCIYVHTKNLPDLCRRLEGVRPSNPAAVKALAEAEGEDEPRACDGCRKRFEPGDQRIEDPDSTIMGTLVYHPKCRDGALWNHMGLIDKETREALVKRVFERDFGEDVTVEIKAPTASRSGQSQHDRHARRRRVVGPQVEAEDAAQRLRQGRGRG